MASSNNEIPDAELRRLFLRAVQLLQQPNCDRRAVNQQLLTCVAADPGNLLIAERFLDNLCEWHGGRTRSRPGFRLRRAIRKAQTNGNWQTIFELAPQALTRDPWHVDALLALAEACEAHDYQAVGLRYLEWALDAQPDNVEVNRRCGRWLARLGRFDEAISCWKRVAENTSDDEEARNMLTQLGAATLSNNSLSNERADLERAIEKQPADASNYFKLADDLMADGNFAAAQNVLSRARTACGANLEVQERTEDLQLAHAQHQVTIARRGSQQDPSEQADLITEQLLANLNRVELEIYRRRLERYPQQVENCFRLAEALEATGSYAEAVKYFKQAVTDERFAAAGYLHLGECQQRLRRFSEALACYEQAIHCAREAHEEEQKLALYRHAVLTEAMGRTEGAEASFTRLIQLDPDFRDAASRLDKLRKIRHK